MYPRSGERLQVFGKGGSGNEKTILGTDVMRCIAF